jgi:protein farnesyltransferase subunit beta
LKDKPGKSADYYHTCYCLSGLAAAQYASNCVLGPRENLLRKADVLINVLEDKLEAALKFYAKSDAGATPAGKEAGTGGEQPGSQRAASKPSAAAAAADVEMANV